MPDLVEPPALEHQGLLPQRRGGVQLGAQRELTIDVENLGDRNYRGMAWGVDAPGIGVAIAYRTTFYVAAGSGH